MDKRIGFVWIRKHVPVHLLLTDRRRVNIYSHVTVLLQIDKLSYLVTHGAMTDELSVNTRSILDYVNKLQGIPYGRWGGKEIAHVDH